MSSRTSRKPDSRKLDATVADANRAARDRELGYREQALRMFPWVCGRCGREFTRANVHELTVHHRNHDHDDNPPDGSNWELLCLYCHDNEHQRQVELRNATRADNTTRPATSKPFADLAALLKSRSDK